MKGRKTLPEIIIIVAFAVAMGYLYNMLTPKPLPLVYKPFVPTAVSDSALFGDAAPDTSKANTITPAARDTASSGTKQRGADTAAIAKNENKNKGDETVLNIKTKTVTFEQMQKIKDNPAFVVIDARGHDAYTKGHIGRAVNIFPYDEEQVYMNKLLDLPKNRTIVIYCDGGQCELSHMVAETLANLGFTRVFIYTGGWEEWSKRGGK